MQSIAKEYGITTADILKFNPEAQKGIYENSILIIPSKSVTSNEASSLATEAEVSFEEHKVKKKETLSSLSREYGISIEDIKKYNPELYSRELQKGEKIRIPVVKKTMVQQTVEAKPVETGNQKLEKYTVKKSEGLYRIAVNHGITLEALKQLNPGVSEDIQEGEELWVPVMKAPVADSTDQYNYYTVKQGEGFYSVEKNTGYSQEIIEKLNPQVVLDGLKAGMILKFPKTKQSLTHTQTILGAPTATLLDSIHLRRVDLALVLPFKVQGMTVDSVPQMANELKTNRLLNVSLDFYSGVLEAVDSLQRHGLDVRLKVLDSQGDEFVVKRMVEEGVFNNINAVIGPLYEKPYNRLATELYTKNIPLFAPLTNKNLKNSANVFSSVPTDEDLRAGIIAYVRAHKAGDNILIFADDNLKSVQDRLKASFPSARIVDKSMMSLSGMRSLLSTTKKNLIFIETNNIPMLTNLTNILNSLVSENIEIQLATTQKTEAYNADSVRNEYLNHLNFLYPSIDKPASNKLSFAKAYYEKYKKFPNKIVTRGFDLAMDVALRIAYGQPLQINSTILGETAYVENKFHYISDSLGYFTNNAVYVVMYKDMEIVEAP